jgi:hypothetical protein
MALIILFFLLLSFSLTGCNTVKTEEVEFYIKPGYEEIIESYSLTPSTAEDENGEGEPEGHIHAEGRLPSEEGVHLVYCKTCGEELRTEAHSMLKSEKRIVYRGTVRYHEEKKLCSCGIYYETEYKFCMSDNTNCYCYDEKALG